MEPSSSDSHLLLLPLQSQHALEDFFHALLRGKEEDFASSPLLLLETVGKKFLKDVVVRVVANANNNVSSEDETSKNVGSGVVRALLFVAKKIEEEIVGRSIADVVLLNCVQRSLHVAKEEISLSVATRGCGGNSSSKEQTKVYKQNVISGIREMISQDIDHARRSVGEFALELCGSDCVVCVLGLRDGLVETFLKNVARKRRVKVIVLETSVSYEENGRAMAEEFARKILNVSSSSSGGGGGGGNTSNNKDTNNNNNNNNNSSVEVMIVPESNAFAVMSRAHLAVVSAQLGVFEDGSFYGPPGTANIARACEKFKVPLVALAPSLSLTTAEKPRMNNDDTSSSSSSINSSNSTTTTTKTTTTTSLLSQERNGNPAEVLKHFRATTTTTGGGGGSSAARDVDAVLHPVREFIDNKNGQQQQQGGHDENKSFFVVEAFVTDHGVVAPENLKQLTRELYA